MDKNVKMFLGVLALAYVLNLTAGIIEILPDNVPLIGNIDDAVAAVVAYNALIKKNDKLL